MARGLRLSKCAAMRIRSSTRTACHKKQQILVIRNRRPDADFWLGSVSSTLPESPLSGEQRHPYYHRPSRVVVCCAVPARSPNHKYTRIDTHESIVTKPRVPTTHPCYPLRSLWGESRLLHQLGGLQRGEHLGAVRLADGRERQARGLAAHAQHAHGAASTHAASEQNAGN